MILADRGIAMSSDELAVFKEPPRELPYVNVHRFLARLGVADPGDLRRRVGPRAAAARGHRRHAAVGRRAGPVRRRGRARSSSAPSTSCCCIEIDGTARRDDACIAFQQVFDERLFDWEFEHFIEYGLDRSAAGRAAARRAATSCAQHFGRLAALPRRAAARAQPPRLPRLEPATCTTAASASSTSRTRCWRRRPTIWRRCSAIATRATSSSPPLEQRLLAYYAQRLGGARRRAVDDRGAVGGLRHLRPAEGVQGRRPLPLSRSREGEAGLPALPARRRGGRSPACWPHAPDLAPVRDILARYVPELRS